MKSIEVKAVIVEHFPAFEYKKVYNEPRQNGGNIIKFWCSKGFDERGPAFERMKDVLKSKGVMGIHTVWNARGGCDLILSV